MALVEHSALIAAEQGVRSHAGGTARNSVIALATNLLLRLWPLDHSTRNLFFYAPSRLFISV